MPLGVGGFINGAYVSSSGVQWAKDTITLLYSSNHFDKDNTKHVICKFNRDDAVFVGSTNSQRLYKSEISRSNTTELNNRWGDELKDIANSGVSDYYILQSYDTGITFVINNTSKSDWKVLAEDLALTFSPELSKQIELYHEKRLAYNNVLFIINNFAIHNRGNELIDT